MMRQSSILKDVIFLELRLFSMEYIFKSFKYGKKIIAFALSAMSHLE